MKIWAGIIVLASTVMAACGGSSEQTAGIDARGNPVVVGVVSQGTITGFGSVIVNGVRYDTSAAAFDIDGTDGTQSDLSVGDVVTIRGTVNDDGTSPRATSVTFDDAVEGPVEAINATAGTITVLGQLVHIDADTSFDDSISPASIDGLALDDIVEVSGLFRADGSIGATRIELKPAGSEFEVTGSVANLAGMQFDINALRVDFSAAQLDNFPSGAPEEGQRVEVKGSSFGAGGELLATRVEFKGTGIGGAAGDQVEVEGFITRFVSPTDFDVAGVPVTTNGSTNFVNGAAADLALNTKVEVEGSIDAGGLVTATEVEIKLANFIRIEGRVDAVGSTTVTIFGLLINTSTATRFEDKSSADLEIFNLTHINPGDYLETRGYETADGIVATQVERDDFRGEVAIRAFVDSVNEPNFTLRGVPIATDGGTEFRDINDQPILAGVFFGQALGRLVEANGSESNGGILADQVDLED